MASEPDQQQLEKIETLHATPLPAMRDGGWRHHMGSWLLQLAFALASAAAMFVLVWSFIGSKFHWIQGLFIPCGMLVVIGLFCLRTERHWRKPARLLTNLLPAIRTGDAPIDELSQVEGGLVTTGVLMQIQLLVHELRQQRAEVAKLEEEMRQRLATRTSALERQIGTLRLQASRDALTGLYNRRMFEGFLERLLGQCNTEKIDLSVLMIDVDNFKTLNDTLGHAAGDELLRNIGQLIRSSVRDQDAPFRFGGDEFVIVLPGCGTDAASRMAKRLSELVDGLSKTLRVPKRPRLSIGIVTLSEMEPGVTAHQLLEHADHLLYEVKRARKKAERDALAGLKRSA